MELNLSFEQLHGLVAGAPNAVAAAMLPIILLAILAEILLMEVRGRRYPWKSSAVSAGVAIGHVLAQAAVNGLVLGVIAAGVYQIRLFDLGVSFADWPMLVLLFLLADLAFYCEHRAAHRIRFLWASHSVHHSIERMVLPAAFRLAWTPILSGVFLFYQPPVWLGFPPTWVFGMVSASLVYQIFVHTELVTRIGWLEWVINTPSAHRVHHATNAEYIDRNFGGVLLIWDHLFASYQAERPDIPIVFGLTHPRSRPTNPFIIAYEELWDMARTLGSHVGATRLGAISARDAWRMRNRRARHDRACLASDQAQ